jgi:tRNA A-37 threonylcarbamoyl transferase component Bud32
MIGKTISHYKILEKLGGGGMGIVYKARDQKLDRLVALKFLPPELTRNTEARARFVAEAKAVSSLQHANICTIHDIEELNEGQMFIVMEYYEGETLSRMIEGGPLSQDDALDIAIQVGRGLAEAHRHYVIHRDLKPANTMITRSGRVQILDFGLAKLAAGSARTKAGTVMGTAAYMSPEQLQGQRVDKRTDIWSLGVVLYQMLTGERPFRSEYEPGLAYAILNTEPVAANTLNQSVSDGTVEVLRKALAKDPARRYQSVEEMVAELVLLRGKVPGVKMGELLKLKWGVKRFRKRVGGVAAGVTLVAGLALFGPCLHGYFFPPPPTSIAVLSCDNQTGEASYDRLRFVVTDALTTKLEQFKDLRVTTQDRLLRLAKRAKLATVDTVDNIAVVGPELGLELCAMEGIEAAILPRITKVENLFVTHVQVVDVKTSRRIAGASAQGLGVESILSSQIDQVVLSIALRLGLGPGEDEPVPPRLADISTSSLEAYSDYLLAGEMAGQTPGSIFSRRLSTIQHLHWRTVPWAESRGSWVILLPQRRHFKRQESSHIVQQRRSSSPSRARPFSGKRISVIQHWRRMSVSRGPFSGSIRKMNWHSTDWHGVSENWNGMMRLSRSCISLWMSTPKTRVLSTSSAGYTP